MLSAPKILFVFDDSARDSTFSALFRRDIFLFHVTRTLRSFRTRYRRNIFGRSQSLSVTTNDWYHDSRWKIRIFLQKPNRLAALFVFDWVDHHVRFPSASLCIATISQRWNCKFYGTAVSKRNDFPTKKYSLRRWCRRKPKRRRIAKAAIERSRTIGSAVNSPW